MMHQAVTLNSFTEFDKPNGVRIYMLAHDYARWSVLPEQRPVCLEAILVEGLEPEFRIVLDRVIEVMLDLTSNISQRFEVIAESWADLKLIRNGIMDTIHSALVAQEWNKESQYCLSVKYNQIIAQSLKYLGIEQGVDYKESKLYVAGPENYSKLMEVGIEPIFPNYPLPDCHEVL